MPIEHFGLYLVLSDPVTSFETCAEAAVNANVHFIQLRLKNSARTTIISVARNLRSITHNSCTRFIINDDPEIAREVAADGVHLGQTDMVLTQARRLYPELRIFGLSTHSHEQALQATQLQPDYCGVGPVFATPTKAIPDPTLGPEQAGEIIQSAPFTTVAIGGIDLNNLPLVLRAGAINFAVVRYVCRDPKPYDAIRRLQDLWQTFQ